MSFDIDPRDKHQRFLMSHPESDSLFEVFSEAEKDNCIGADPLCADVTDIPEWEARFKREQDEKGR